MLTDDETSAIDRALQKAKVGLRDIGKIKEALDEATKYRREHAMKLKKDSLQVHAPHRPLHPRGVLLVEGVCCTSGSQICPLHGFMLTETLAK